ncbi:EmrB/QacA subfamily drug resistance transporter [Krasilnikovia cinnamomea]|uniref:EmrB/QacA subfamily drug resistance transporter n=1 Tax=Krasilnikovia cinnamomea TaxID=349313 RepID=A0A4Q7ZTE8_9ACTN|nr:DHA2 family efflux MFS transporter permease subunit [Krasilnikovia cinnamomea]RZU54518.1 EmrB/QacA subfamily drug resistance transporter [Krasilnikovia cinnamomea]
MSGAAPHRRWWVLALVSLALFMVTLDNLVVTTALPSIRTGLSASLPQLEWVVNAYTVSFAVLLLLGAALGDRFGHRRMFVAGLAVFTAASAVAAAASSAEVLIAARAVQGAGGAVVLPISLTLLAGAFPGRQRGLAFGVFSGVSGLGVALGPVVGGAITQAASWPYIFAVNVPVGIVGCLAAPFVLARGAGPARRLDLPGAALVTGGLAGIMVALVAVPEHGWTSGRVTGPLAAGAVLLAGFVAWERRAPEPMLPLRFFANPVFTAVNLAGVAMYFGMFGAIFLLAPFLQTVQGHEPLAAGLRILPWTVMPLVVSPLAGMVSERWGARRLIGGGLVLQALALGWLAWVLTPQLSFAALLVPAVLGGAGMALVYPPAASAALGAVRPHEAGAASGAMNALREAGGAFGIAVLAWVFTANGGGTASGAYVSGLVPALAVGALVLAAGAVAAWWLPGPAAPAAAPPVPQAAAPRPVPVEVVGGAV